MTVSPRTSEQRRRDTEHRLAHDVDIWVATASADGVPYLVPLSFHWDGETILLSTPEHSRTAKNLHATGNVRLGLGPTRDVTMIDGEVESLAIDELPAERADLFAAHAGFDPRNEKVPYRWFRIRPRRMQAWREANELADREIMAGGRWLT